ncbi:MAG: hypothetical protein DRP26_07560, partial [Candidatus Zixiibacteriota bacterium]
MPIRHLKEYISYIKLFSPNARLYLAGTFFMGFSNQILWMLYNLYLKQLGFAEGTMGEILFFEGLGTVLAAIPAAIAIDYIRLKNVMVIANLINTLSYVFLTFVIEIKVLYLIAVITGAGWTVHFIAASPFFMRNSTTTERTHLFSFNYALDMMSGLVGALIGGYIPILLFQKGVPLIIGYRVSLIFGAIMTLSAVIFYIRIKTPRPIKAGKIDWRNYIRSKNWKVTFRLCLPQFFMGMGAGLVIPFLNIYFVNRFTLDSSFIGKIYSVGQLFMVIGFLAGPIFGKKIGLVRTVSFSQLASIPFFLILAFGYYLPPVIIAFWFRGSLMNMAWPLYNNFAMEKVEPNQHATTNSFLSLAWNSSWMISTLIGGRLIEY